MATRHGETFNQTPALSSAAPTPDAPLLNLLHFLLGSSWPWIRRMRPDRPDAPGTRALRVQQILPPRSPRLSHSACCSCCAHAADWYETRQILSNQNKLRGVRFLLTVQLRKRTVHVHGPVTKKEMTEIITSFSSNQNTVLT